MTNSLLPVVEAFLLESGMSAYRFGLLAAKNGRLVDRLREGRRVWPETDAQVRAFIISKNSDAAKKRRAA